jgi:hypothetical protein
LDDAQKLSQLGITSATKLAALILITPPQEKNENKDAAGDRGPLKQRERPQVSCYCSADGQFVRAPHPPVSALTDSC